MEMKTGWLKAGSFPDDFIQECFILWYNNGKPTANRLLEIVGECNGQKPKISTLKTWIAEVFRPRALILDEEAARAIESSMIAGKVEMFSRHIEVARKMQDSALEYLEEHGPESARNAISMLKLGLETERSSVSIPDMISKISDMTEDKILEEIQQLALEGEIIDIEPNDDN